MRELYLFASAQSSATEFGHSYGTLIHEIMARILKRFVLSLQLFAPRKRVAGFRLSFLIMVRNLH